MSDTWLELPKFVKVDSDGIIFIRGDNLDELSDWVKEQIKNR